MPLQLPRGGVLTAQDILRRLQHKQPSDSKASTARIRCLPHFYKGCRHNEGEETVRRLTDDVESLEADSQDSGADHRPDAVGVKNAFRRTLSEDVQKQLHRVLDVIKELTAEKGEPAACKRHMPTEEAVELLEQFIAADLPVQLLTELPLLQFEARKDVMNVCCALLWPGMPQQVDKHVIDYLGNHARIFPLLVGGYANEEAALHYGVVLRSCARHKELVEAFLQTREVFGLIEYTRHPSIDIASDAFYSLREVLLEHKDVSAAWLDENYHEFFAKFNGLLQSEDYLVERQALTLLAGMMLDRHFKRVMVRYVCDEYNLQIIMNHLRDTSKTIQVEAFHVFRVFVANPQKPQRVHQILFKNKDKLVELIETIDSLKVDDQRFSEDKRILIQKLLPLPAPPRAAGVTPTAARTGVAVPPTTCRAAASASALVRPNMQFAL